MGQIERIEHKLNLICQHLGIVVDLIGTFIEATVETVAKPIFTAVEGVESAAVAPTPAAPAAQVKQRIKVVDALAAGKGLTGEELDEQGCYWDKSINTDKPAVTQKNIWKKGRGVDEALYDKRIAEIKAEAGTVLPPATVAATTPAAVTAAVLGTALPGLPLPGVGAALPGLPLPGVPTGHQSSLEDPIRKEIIQFTNALTNKYQVDYDVIGQLFGELGATENNFVSLSDAAYPAAHKALNAWAKCLDLIEDADKEVLAMNGNDGSYMVKIMTHLQIGTTSLETTQHQDLYRLYTKIAEYRGQLEAHFGKPVTPVAVNPFA